jgi:beta-glucosidase
MEPFASTSSAAIRTTMALPQWEHLSLREQIAQMIVVRASGYLFDHQIQYPQWEPTADILRHYIQDLGVGGVILLGGSAVEVGLRSRQLQDWARIPLLIAADIEEGVGQRFPGATWFPPPMALSAIAAHSLEQAVNLAETMGAVTAQEALAIGLNWVLAPVVDVNNNAQNPVINVRAFGETPELVSKLTTAFIRGTQRHAVLTAAKHFPGHGDTATDSHLELPVLAHSRQRLMQVEWPPFKAAIAAGVDAVMTAHLQIPSLDSKYPATLSQFTLTEELRQRMGFDGLIVTDALVMGAITNRYGANETPVLAVEAGADVVLMPVDPEGAIAAIHQAVETGRLSLERIQASVERIWRAKQRVTSPAIAGSSSHAWENVHPPAVQLDQLAQPTAIAAVDTIVRRSMQVCHPSPSRLEYPSDQQNLCNLVIVDDALACTFLGRQAPAIALPQQRGYQLMLVDSYTSSLSSDLEEPNPNPSQNSKFKIQNSIFSTDTINHISTQHPTPNTLLQLFIRGNPFRSSANLTRLAHSWFQFLLESNQLQALMIYGSPYVLEKFLPALPADIPYGFSYGHMPQAQAIALQSLLGTTFSIETIRGGEQKIGDREFTD